MILKEGQQCNVHKRTEGMKIKLENKIKENHKVHFNLGANKVKELSSKDISECTWHSSNDLKEMRQQVRNICNKMTCDCVTTFRNVTTCVDSSSRGLEAYICNERYRRKKLTIRSIVKNQNKLSVNMLSKLYNHMSSWAYDLARYEAERDYYKVYTNLY